MTAIGAAPKCRPGITTVARLTRASRIVVLLLIPAFLACLVFIQQSGTARSALGLTFAQESAGGAWIVTDVTFASQAHDAGIKEGATVRLIDGQPIGAGAILNTDAANRVQQITVVNPNTSKAITIGALGRTPFDFNLLPYLIMGLVFFAVGFVTVLVGRGSAPRALALLCISGSIEAIILPLSQRQIGWALILNGICVPIFIGGFAYLFLVFPARRALQLQRYKLAAEWVLLPIIPISLTQILAVTSNNAPLLLLSRVLGFPYFLICFVGGVVALIASWRYATPGRERAQLQTVGIGAITAIAPFLLLSLLPLIFLNRAIIPPDYTVLFLALIPLAFGYAMLRYQVMNMHLYVRRGVVYSVLGAIITGIYALGLAIATIAVRDRAVGGVAVVAVVVAIVVITGDRLRAHIQRYVDRFFDREGYDYRNQLLELSQRMNSILDPDELAQSAVELIGQTMSARHVRLYLHDRNMGSFHLWAHAGTTVVPDEQVLATHHATLAEVREARWEVVQHFEIPREEDDALLVPLVHKGQPVALLTLGLKRADLPYSSEDIALLSTVASQLAIATENAQLYGRMRALYLSGIRTLAATVDAKDSYTHGHSERVAGYARAIALALGLPQLEVETIELAGLLHDIGKIGVPDAILQKPGRLDPDERTLIEQHADLGARILSDNPALMPLVPLVRHHHERWDGRGYPSGLRGEEIPIGAAVICVADTFDTMTTDRPYRRAPGLEEARAEIAKCSGGQFAPHVVEAFLQASISGHKLLTPQQKAVDQQPGLAMAGQATEVNVRAMRIVYQIAQLLGTSAELSAFLKRVVEILRRELATKTVDFFIVDQATQRLYNRLGAESTLGMVDLPFGQGLVGWVAEHQTAVRIDDMRNDPRIIFVDGGEGRSELAVPLISEGRTIAVLNAESSRLAAFSDEDTMLLTIIAGQLAQVIEVANLHQEARQAARVDGLTEVANHRHFYDRLEIEVAQAAQDSTPLALAILDVNGLKALNDTYGHLAGDTALRTLARTLGANTRGQELIARYGGDEFAILFPGMTKQSAEARVATLQEALSREADFAMEGRRLPLPKVSIGVAALGQEADTALALVALADKRMYAQKDSMRVVRR